MTAKKTEPESELKENIIAILVVVIIVAGAWFGFTQLGSKDEIISEQRYPITIDDDPLLGDVNAPITIIEFSDFECTHCATVEKEILPQLKEKYIDTGIVRFVFRDFPIETIHPDVQFVHEAAGCAYDQDKFWEYHDRVFERQTELSPSVLGEIADEIGLDRVQFDDCRLERKYLEEIQSDINDGRLMGGVSGTPTFFVNGKKITGAQPIEVFDEIISAELAAKVS